MPGNNHSSRVRWAALTLFVLAGLPFAQQRGGSQPKPAFIISGTVVGSLTNQPLPHTEVEIGFALKSETVQSLITGDDGRFEFDDVAAGKYWLTASRNGYSRQGFEEHDGFFTGIVTGTDVPSQNLIFRLRPDASISGVVSDEQNEPLRDAQVMLFHTVISEGRRVTTLAGQVVSNDQGRYRFGHLSAGTYFVAVSARPWYAEAFLRRNRRFRSRNRPGPLQPDNSDVPSNPEMNVAYPLTFYSGVSDWSAANAIVLKAGDRASADINLSTVHALTLRIHHSDVALGQPFGATLKQRVFGDREIQVPQDDVQVEKGQVVISGLAPGEFSVTTQSYGKDARSWSQTINLTADTDITLPVNVASAPISGTVVVNGTPLGRKTYLQMRDRQSGNSMGAEVSARGDFEIPASEVQPGTYQMSVSSLADGVVAGVTASGAKVIGQRVVISGTGPVRLSVNIASEGLASVSGTAWKDDKPLAGAMIVLVPQDVQNTALFRRDQSDSDGTFSLREILPGKYIGLAIKDGWDLEWANPSVLSPYLKGGEAFEVLPGGKYELKLKVH
jgi:hypothetical protein